MTARIDDVGRRLERATAELRHGLAELAELERVAPQEVGAIAGALVAHLRSWRPEAVAPLGTLPPPTDRICDPRASEAP